MLMQGLLVRVISNCIRQNVENNTFRWTLSKQKGKLGGRTWNGWKRFLVWFWTIWGGAIQRKSQNQRSRAPNFEWPRKFGQLTRFRKEFLWKKLENYHNCESSFHFSWRIQKFKNRKCSNDILGPILYKRAPTKTRGNQPCFVKIHFKAQQKLLT